MFVCLQTSLLCSCADEEEEEGGEKNLCVFFGRLFLPVFFVSLIGQFAFLLLCLSSDILIVCYIIIIYSCADEEKEEAMGMARIHV